ncbi:MAG: chemotaxis protein CheW [Bacteroidales bacterium]|nr:chemotaxis protein CheW [Bacteroidales bacterium]
MNEQSSTNKVSYLTFKLDKEFFSADVKYVLEILELPEITKVPQSPKYMRGVINLRGSVLPVIDTRLKFGLPEVEYSKSTCIIVFEFEKDHETVNIGAIVDSTEKVIEVDSGNILPTPGIGEKYKAEYITGIINKDDIFIMILDVDKLFSTEEISIIKND